MKTRKRALDGGNGGEDRKLGGEGIEREVE